ncbi:MAG: c-type cytochrome [Magnetococcales bacterium]|nr:c-type cytochrome [Magnetococcales bacterium]
MTRSILSFCLVFFLPFVAIAQEINEDDVDLYNGRDVNIVCAACHGELGQGGNKGEYPRLAGQMRSILIRQLRSFRDRKRINIPMLPYTEERELPEEDMIDVASYLSSLRIDVTIPYVEGDVKAGKKLFKDCRKCHGKEGRGKEKKGESNKHGPALTGQYPSYLIRQMSNFKKGIRKHEDMEETAQDITDEELNDILAYLVTLERHPGLAEEVEKENERRFGTVINSLSETIKASGSGEK